jgi:prepilin-type processing-associated H-X9-DG protein
LVAAAIIAVLASLLLPSLRQARLNALRARDAGSLRQVGAAVLGYAGDHDQLLPGPVPIGIIPLYCGGPLPTNYLGSYLAPYLDTPIPASANSWATCTPLVSAGMRAAVKTNNISLVNNYLANYGSSDLPPDPGAPMGRLSLFGSINSTHVKPARLSTLATLGLTSKAWILCDPDQQCTQLSGLSWFSALPAKPVHGDSRNFLFVDGHVEARPLSFQP